MRSLTIALGIITLLQSGAVAADDNTRASLNRAADVKCSKVRRAIHHSQTRSSKKLDGPLVVVLDTESGAY
jgi:hypothetical protein